MKPEIEKYPVKHPLLKKYIKFFWEIHAANMQLHHKVIPVRNIDLKFNLNDTPHYLCLNGEEHLLEEVYFSGLQDHNRNAHIKLSGKVDVLGICFLPEGLYPFLKIPLSEFKNQLLGSDEVGFKIASKISTKLKEADSVKARLDILETELVALLDNNFLIPDSFQELFNSLKENNNSLQIAEFCERNGISLRTLERMYNKYVGVSAKTYGTLNRFQNSLNKLLSKDFSKLSDIAYRGGYFDQMHFIKDFKRFAGNTPKNFLNKKDSMLQVGKLSDKHQH